MKRVLIAAAGIAVLAAAVGVYVMAGPYQGFEGETFVRFDRGTGTQEMGRALARAGVIRYPWQFWIERLRRPRAKLPAGEYRFDRPETAAEVFDRIARGEVYYFEFTVTEGSNMFDIARSLEIQGVMPAAVFLRAASDPDVHPRSCAARDHA